MTDAFETSIHIDAPPQEVFDHFVRPELLVRWMGEYARLEATAGGLYTVDIDGVLIRGEFVVVDPPRFIEIAWGEAGNEIMPPGATRLTIELEPTARGTYLKLTHAGLVEPEAEKHAFGWPIFLERLAVAAPGGDPGPYPWTNEPGSAKP